MLRILLVAPLLDSHFIKVTMVHTKWVAPSSDSNFITINLLQFILVALRLPSQLTNVNKESIILVACLLESHLTTVNMEWIVLVNSQFTQMDNVPILLDTHPTGFPLHKGENCFILLMMTLLDSYFTNMKIVLLDSHFI